IPQCANSPAFTLNFGNPTGGAYTVNGIAQTQFDPSVYSVGNHQINYTYTDNNGCVDSASGFITVNQLPLVSYSVPSAVCEGTAVNLTFSPSGGNLLVDGIANVGTYNAQNPGTYPVDYTYN
ncbi:MAG: hypothetical protein ACK559_05595, partial [bacterium]